MNRGLFKVLHACETNLFMFTLNSMFTPTHVVG